MDIKGIIKEELNDMELYRSRKILSNPYGGLRFKSKHNNDVEYYTILDVVDNDEEPAHLKITNNLDRVHTTIEYDKYMDSVRGGIFIAVDVELDDPLNIFTNKYGEEMTLMKKDGVVFIKHDDINKDKFIPLMNKSSFYSFHKEEKDFIEKFINET